MRTTPDSTAPSPPAERALPGSFEVRIEAESPFFAGHFPGDPILPGVQLLGIVLKAVRDTEPREVTLRGLRDFRLRSAVRPGDLLRVQLSRATVPEEIRFTIKKGDLLVGTGLLTIAPSSGG